MHISAAVTESKSAPFRLEDVELGELRDDEILVKVAAAGVCHTDLIVRDQWYPVPLPAVLGHEGAGVVEKVGSAVRECAPGDSVGMSFHSCGSCTSCWRGRPSYCLDLARELGATHAIDARAADAGSVVIESTAGGVDLTLETTGSPAVFRQAVDCLAPTGTCGLIGAPAFGTEVSLDVNTILVGGRTVRGIVEGDSVPQLFLPTLMRLWADGRFPVDRLMQFYDFDRIDEAAADAAAGRVIKPVLRMS
jgi:Zn-dependent alcohol dehydrogenase